MNKSIFPIFLITCFFIFPHHRLLFSMEVFGDEDGFSSGVPRLPSTGAIEAIASNFNLGDVPENIRIFFFPEETAYREGDDYAFQVTIENQSPDKTFRFHVYDEPFQQFSFSIKKGFQDFSLKKLNYYRFLYDRGPFSTRKKPFALEYRESYSRSISLGDFFAFDEPGLYEISGRFYPLGIEENDYHIPLQPFVLRIHPRLPEVPNISRNQGREAPSAWDGRVSLLAQKSTIRRATPLFPNEVVEDHFERIRTRDYTGYLNNLELEKLLVNSYNSTEAFFRYEGAGVYEQKIIIEDFKNFLIERIDYTLVESSVLKTVVIDDTAVVEAVMAVREPFENYRQTIDLGTGEPHPVWIKESVNRLVKYYHLTFDLEKISLFASKPWKITAYVTRVISSDRYQSYKKRLPQPPPEISPSAVAQDSGDRMKRLVHFGYNQSVVEENYISQIKQIAQFLVAHPELGVEVYGHTDTSGEEDYNYELSRRRVESVASLLISAGVELSRMRFFYKGETEPIATGDTEEDRRLNRRVEIYIQESQP